MLVHGAVLPPETSLGEGRQPFQGTRVGENVFSETQGPKDLPEPKSTPKTKLRDLPDEPVPANERSGQGFGIKRKPLAERGVQAVGPAAERGGIGHWVRVFERRRRLFPGAVLHQHAPPMPDNVPAGCSVCKGEKATAGEGEGLPASGAATATDANPVVMLIVSLLAAASVTDDRIAFTNGASPPNDPGTA